MRAIVFSDSHKNLNNMIPIVEANVGHADYIFHLGDCVSDFEDLRACYPTFKIEGVCGNNDWRANGVTDLILTVGNHRVFMTHGHLYDVKVTLARLLRKAKEVEADVLLYGHTHVPFCRTIDGILVMNPGSISRPSLGKASFGSLDFLESSVIGNITEI